MGRVAEDGGREVDREVDRRSGCWVVVGTSMIWSVVGKLEKRGGAEAPLRSAHATVAPPMGSSHCDT